MRGKARYTAPPVRRPRITPAYAGKSCFRNLITVDSRDHPRLCGEKDNNPILLFFKEGSPPPMRGKVASMSPFNMVSRITPAYAGKSETARTWEDLSTDHPRLCGEKAVVYRFIYFRIGSPPPMRGKVVQCSEIDTVSRITPAYAGKRSASCGRVEAVRDHPRLCGEKPFVGICTVIALGSPPPMRGKG